MKLWNNIKKFLGRDTKPDTQDDIGYQPSTEERVLRFAQVFPDTSARFMADERTLERRRQNRESRRQKRNLKRGRNMQSPKFKGWESPVRVCRDGTIYDARPDGWRKRGKMASA